MSENQRTITLPTIPRQVAELIEEYRREDEYPAWENDRIIAEVLSDMHIDNHPLRSIPFDTLLSALVNGYTVEKSAEELEREAHCRIRLHYDMERDTEWAVGYCNGIEFTLATLGIKIEGVNA